MTAKTRVTVLVENTAQGAGLLAEHGLAYWIERGEHQVLFDTGQSGMVVMANARTLDVPLAKVDAIALSHGHFDHTGGLAEVLCEGRPEAIYFHAAALAPKFIQNKDKTVREITMPAASRAALEAFAQDGGRLVETQSPVAVVKGLMLTGPVPRVSDFEDTGGPFFLDAGCTRPDPLADDQSVFFETAKGIVVLLGCAHAGVINTLGHVRELSGGKPLAAVIGGMHLVGASPQRIARTVEELRRLEVPLVAPCHCTGMTATVALYREFAEHCVACHVGSRFEF